MPITEVRTKDGVLHSLFDADGNMLPAMIDRDPSIISDNGEIYESRRYFVNGRLSRRGGPAVEYVNTPEDCMYLIDGVGLCAEGQEMGKKIACTPELLTYEEIVAMTNEEVKRVAIEEMGVEKFLTEGNAKIVDTARNDIEGTIEKVLATKDVVYFCGVCKSTGRVYYISVPPDCRTCDDARKFMSSGKDLNSCIGAS